MKISKTLNKDELTIAVIGELNTTTYQELEDVVKNSLNGIKKLVFDFKELEYISSAGLRVLLVSKKLMDQQGKLVVKHANSSVKEIFDITGFTNILDFED